MRADILKIMIMTPRQWNFFPKLTTWYGELGYLEIELLIIGSLVRLLRTARFARLLIRSWARGTEGYFCPVFKVSWITVLGWNWRDPHRWLRRSTTVYCIIVQWVETAWYRRVQFININHFPKSSRVSEQMSAAERASKASSTEQANERAVRANEQREERMAQYSTRRFLIIWTHCALGFRTKPWHDWNLVA